MTLRRLAHLRLLKSGCLLENGERGLSKVALLLSRLGVRFALGFGHFTVLQPPPVFEVRLYLHLGCLAHPTEQPNPQHSAQHIARRRKILFREAYLEQDKREQSSQHQLCVRSGD